MKRRDLLRYGLGVSVVAFGGPMAAAGMCSPTEPDTKALSTSQGLRIALCLPGLKSRANISSFEEGPSPPTAKPDLQGCYSMFGRQMLTGAIMTRTKTTGFEAKCKPTIRVSTNSVRYDRSLQARRGLQARPYSFHCQPSRLRATDNTAVLQGRSIPCSE